MGKKVILTGIVFFLFLMFFFTACDNSIHKGESVQKEQAQQAATRMEETSRGSFSADKAGEGMNAHASASTVGENELSIDEKKPAEAGTKKERYEGIPVLMYHSVAHEPGNPVRIPKERFQEQMQYLKSNGYNAISLDELYAHLKKNTPLPPKPVIITFDDGYADNYTTAYPILKSLGFKAVVFMITDAVDNDPSYLTSEQLIELDKNGVKIESHTVHHENLITLTYKMQYDTLSKSKARLEAILGREVKYIAYPFGTYNDAVLKCVKEAGYTMALTTNKGWVDKRSDLFQLPRVYIDASYDMEIFKERITDPDYRLIGAGVYKEEDNKTAPGNEP